MKPLRRNREPEPAKPGPRARDTDRDEAVEELQSAYVDGQIDADERERRTDLALKATHLVDLEPLIRDLQVSPRVPAPAPTDGTSEPVRKKPKKRTPAKPTNHRDGLPLGAKIGMGVAVASMVVAGIGVAASLGGAFDGDSEGGTDAGQAELAHQPTVQWSNVKDQLPTKAKGDAGVDLPRLTTWSITRDNVRALLDGYREQLGTPYFRRLTLHPDWLTIDRPVAGAGPTVETWTYDESGSFTRGETARGDGDMTLMNVRDLDVDRLFDNIDGALKELESDDAELLHVTVDLKQGNPSVQIYATDKHDITVGGYWATTLSGKVYEGGFTK